MKHLDILILLSYHCCQGNRGLLILLSEMKVKTGKERKNSEPASKTEKKICVHVEMLDVFAFLVKL